MGNEASVPAEFGSLVVGGAILRFAPRRGSVLCVRVPLCGVSWGLGGRGTADPPGFVRVFRGAARGARTRAHTSQKIIFTALRRGFALIGLYLGYIPL